MNASYQIESYELLIKKLKSELLELQEKEGSAFTAAYDAMDFIEEHNLMDEFASWVISEKNKETAFLKSITELYNISEWTDVAINNKLNEV